MTGLTSTACLILASVFSATLATSVVELYIAVDKKVIDNYVHTGTPSSEAQSRLTTDIDYILTETNKIMADLDVEVRARKIDILSENVFRDCEVRDGKIHEDLGLYAFERYMVDNNLFATLNYDMALLWTGFNIFGQNDAVAGYAKVNQLCNEKAVTFIEFDGAYRTAPITAHEIGHVIGLQHDTGACANGHIMEDTLNVNSPNKWKFSSCAISTAPGLLAGKSCLDTTNAASTAPSTLAPAHLEDLQVVCKRSRNDSGSSLCMGSNLYNGMKPQGDIMCQRIYCLNNEDGYCYTAHATNGMVCGENKRCNFGSCETAPANHPTPSGTTDDCLFGDEEDLNLSSGTTTCTAFLGDGNDHQCYSQSIEAACCGTCASLHTGIEGCEYGDRSSQCVSYSRDAICPGYKDYMCCGHCQGWVAKRDLSAVLRKSRTGDPELHEDDVKKAKQRKGKDEPAGGGSSDTSE